MAIQVVVDFTRVGTGKPKRNAHQQRKKERKKKPPTVEASETHRPQASALSILGAPRVHPLEELRKLNSTQLAMRLVTLVANLTTLKEAIIFLGPERIHRAVKLLTGDDWAEACQIIKQAREEVAHEQTLAVISRNDGYVSKNSIGYSHGGLTTLKRRAFHADALQKAIQRALAEQAAHSKQPQSVRSSM
jgi:hypothetical protein